MATGCRPQATVSGAFRQETWWYLHAERATSSGGQRASLRVRKTEDPPRRQRSRLIVNRRDGETLHGRRPQHPAKDTGSAEGAGGPVDLAGGGGGGAGGVRAGAGGQGCPSARVGPGRDVGGLVDGRGLSAPVRAGCAAQRDAEPAALSTAAYLSRARGAGRSRGQAQRRRGHHERRRAWRLPSRPRLMTRLLEFRSPSARSPWVRASRRR